VFRPVLPHKQPVMGSIHGKRSKLPIVPLPKDVVLLPGVTLRIPVSNRPDIANLLSTLLNRTASLKRERVVFTLACVPLKSPYLSADGQQLLDDGASEALQDEEYEAIDAGQARKEDLFAYGTVAKMVGVQGRAHTEPYLVVEGIRRFEIVEILQERPFFEAEVMLNDESGRIPTPALIT
jgi:ATP-dependent Lon protease